MQPTLPAYDYVIAGGGSAGCVMANRLSADPAITVLLIEAGLDMPPGQEPAEIRSPVPSVIFHGTRYMWPDLRVVPFRDRDGDRFYEQARVLGGGSSINAQVGNRGIPDDYDEWERLGAAGWGWNDVLPYFRKLEHDLDFAGNSEMHGADGPIPLYRVPREQWPVFSTTLAGVAEKAGLRDIGDQNAVFDDGYFSPAYTNEHDQRVSASMAYLPATVRARPNLTIVTEAMVTSLTFDGMRAVGLTYVVGDCTIEVAAGEVLLALGALHTPAMLMRAGIGPAAVLAQHDIAPRVISEGVGKNLRDHPGTHLCALVKPHARMPARLKKSGHVAFRFTSRQEGALPSDLYMHCGVSSGWHGVGKRVAYFYFWLNKSRSTGEVVLRDKDPLSRPIVRMNLLSADGDAERLADGFRFIAGLLRDQAMSSVIERPFAVRFSPFIRFMNQVRAPNRIVMNALGRLLDGPAWLRRWLAAHVLSNAPGIDEFLGDPERLKHYLKTNVMSVSHVTCTCRMGAADDQKAVVDVAGRVHGIMGLRVIDASVMPSLPRANTNLAVMMIAEKLAVAILHDRATEGVAG
ncbi:GMC family oxidoreductase N-terminal domain-containing protein [Tardiphaga sp.]|uniref:GMC family oxidoreductase n=1 Tax=Tardiphaga sp. TaxID=1926292 RepID=UPI00262891A5|nr:GMC family oxidoreductase N-terminal domain-containing protein [Tardiphaga sp.]MDB5617251.1 glucose-methanol-choline oxidoreductase [Tardiphaga sp.]